MEKNDEELTFLDASFIEEQRKRLISLRDNLIVVADRAGYEEQAIQSEASGEAHDDADSAARMAIQENDEAQFQRVLKRLAQVRRAIEKIEVGTYGLSDKSGEPIAKARLIAIPEAIMSLSEEQDEERVARRLA